MERWERKRSLLEKTAQTFDLPVDGLAGLPHISLTGDRELRVENHKGILSYGSDEIHVGCAALTVRITGTGLQLRAMNEAELLITGQILAVELM